ncbi:MAG: hypothetical protein ACYC55_02495, partial [Candidatus Geothermincolia bacterium]
AEGTPRAGFEEYLCLMNPGPETATARCAFMLEDGTRVERAYEIEAGARRTVFVNEEVPPEHDVSIGILSDRGIVAERAMYFRYHDRFPQWQTVDRQTLAVSYGWGETWKGPVTRPLVALTFDMEGDQQAAAVILDILSRYDVNGT